MALDSRIRELLYKEIITELSETEKEELNNWLNLSKDNAELYSEIINKDNVQDYLQKRSKINTDETWNLLEKKYERLNRNTFIRTFSKYAAVILFVLSVGTVFYNIFTQDNIPNKIAKVYTIKPGNSKAKLIFSNGKQISLSSTTNTKIVNDSILIINDGTNSKKYIPQHKEVHKNDMTKIIVPRGGEYSLILSDGTKVYLNSESRIDFPLEFTGNKREVIVQGEAFFDVTKDKTKPFIIKTDLMDVVVKGTSFNIKNYPDEEKVHTTLVTGNVDIYYGKDKKRKVNIIPSQQAEINRATKDISIKEVDTYVYTSWIRKCFVFRNQRLEDIMNTLSRWYDVEIFYQNREIKDLVFSGRLDRYEDIKSILEIIESTQKIKAKINNRTIILRNK